MRTRGPTFEKSRPSQDTPQGFRVVRPARAAPPGEQKLEPASTAGEFYDGRMRQITNSQATPRTSTATVPVVWTASGEE